MTIRSLSEDSYAKRIRDFFDANPDEELTISDICVKLNICETAAYRLVGRLKQKGSIEAHYVFRKAQNVDPRARNRLPAR